MVAWLPVCHSLSLASVKSRLVLPFWYRLTRVVLDKGSINECMYVCVCADYYVMNKQLLLVIELRTCDYSTRVGLA